MKVDTAADDEDPSAYILIWEGHLTKLITSELTYSTPFYTKITKALKRMGCITQLRRGGGNAESQWQLNFEPTEEAFTMTAPSKIPAQGKVPQLEQQMRALTSRINRLEESVNGIVQALSKEETP